MSELPPYEPVAPPPPPPPPPPRTSAAESKPDDFLAPFTFVFEDPRWLSKVLLGGLFVLASAVIVGIFFILGYMARLARNVIAGNPRPLPEWDDLGEYFGEGLRLAGVGFVYAIPMWSLIGIFIVPSVLMAGADVEAIRTLGAGLSAAVWCLIFPISLAMLIWLPAALLMSVVEGRFGAAFEFARIWTFIKANAANYAIAIVIAYVARFASSFGIVLCCVGVVFTSFWSMCVTTFAVARVYRFSAIK